ncbi:MAG: hypothetical protein P8H39_05745 [Thalassotalea sp.]|nr:hypothetical protein [Thalassotalea sp.]
MTKNRLTQRINELADKLIEGTSSAAEDMEFKELYSCYKLQSNLVAESESDLCCNNR